MSEGEGKKKREMGMFAGFWMLVGLACLGVSAISALNTAFDLNLALGSYGSSTPLPKHWEEVAGLTVASLMIIALSYFGSTVAHYFKEAKGKPLVRVGIIVGAIGSLVVVGRGLQIVALTMTYGSMLAYYCTDEGSLEDVQGALEGATADELDACIDRTAQWDRHDLLETVVAAGANFNDDSGNPEYRRCVLSSDVSVDYVEKAIKLGATPGNCAGRMAVIQQLLRWKNSSDDEDTAKKVELLIAAGYDVNAKEPDEERSALDWARKGEMPTTIAVLEAAGATGEAAQPGS